MKRIMRLKTRGRQNAKMSTDDLLKCTNVDQFLQILGGHFFFSFPAQDAKGHRADIRFTVSPAQVAMLSMMRERCPEEWFRTQAMFHRAIFSLGSQVMLCVMERENKDVADLKRMCYMLNTLSRSHRVDELEKEFAKLEKKLSRSNLPNLEQYMETFYRCKEGIINFTKPVKDGV